MLKRTALFIHAKKTKDNCKNWIKGVIKMNKLFGKRQSIPAILILCVFLCNILLAVPSVPVYAQNSRGDYYQQIYTTHQGNPFLPPWEYIPDAEPYVFEDPDNPGKYRVYIYGSHDMMVSGYCGWDLVTWSAPVEDLTKWRYDGVIFESIAGGVADVLYAPDVQEVVDKETGKKTYYLFPNNQSGLRISQVAKSDRPDGPFETINWADENKIATIGPLSFDPAVLVDDDGRVYGFWGIRGSEGCELDPNMYALKEGTEIIKNVIPTGDSEFRFFEASSIRKIKDTYVMVYARSGYSGEPFGTGFDQLAYAWSSPKSGGGPFGPYTWGGILVDSGGEAIPNQQGTSYSAGMASNNTHGGLFEVNGQWYITYHRGNNGFARQTMVEPIRMEYNDETGEVRFLPMPGRSEYPFVDDYRRKPVAEMTSMGFFIDGLDPYRKHSAGIACFMVGNFPTASWGTTRPNVRAAPRNERGIQGYEKGINSLAINNIRDNAVIGYKYFNFDGTAPEGKTTQLELGLQPLGQDAKIEVYLRGPELANTNNLGEKIGEFELSADMPQEYTTLRIPVPRVDEVDGLQGIFFRFVAPTAGNNDLCELWDLQFVIEDRMFEDEFENDLTNWSVNGEVAIDDSALILSGEGSQAIGKVGERWDNYCFETNVKSLNGVLNVRFRQSDRKNYYELAVSNNKLELYSSLYGEKSLLQTRDFNIGNGPFKLTVDAVGDVLSVRVGPTLALTTKNDDHEIGTVGFAAAPDGSAAIESVTVSKSVYSPQAVYVPPRPVRDNLTLNGSPIPGFSSDIRTYFVEVPDDGEIPQLGASSDYADVMVTAIQADGVPGTAIARFLDTEETRTYFVKFIPSDDQIIRTQQSFAGLTELPEGWRYFNTSEIARGNVAFDSEGILLTAPGTVEREDYPSNPETAQFPHIELINTIEGDWEVTAEFENVSDDVSGGGGAYGGFGLGLLTPGGAYVKFMRMNGNSIQMAGTGMSEFNYSFSTPNLWLRLRKVGNTVTGYRSRDGIQWEYHGGYVLDDSFNDAHVQIFATTNMGTKTFTVRAKNFWTADLGELSQVPSSLIDVENALPLIGKSVAIPKGSYDSNAARAAKATEVLNTRADLKALGVACEVTPSGDQYRLSVSKDSSVMNIDPFEIIEIVCDWADLQNAVSQAELLSEDDYTFASWNKLINALNGAYQLDENSDPVAINNACHRLLAALENMDPIDDGSVKAIITCPALLEPGESFEVGIKINNAGQNVFAQDITLSYDADVFEYVSAAIENDNMKLLREDTAVDGKIRLIIANIGGLSGNDAINLIFRVKTGIGNTTGIIAITGAKLGIAPEGTVTDAAVDSKNIVINEPVPVVDKTALTAAINDALDLYDAAVVGTEPGQYPQEAKDALYAAINSAKAVRDDPGATQSQVDNAVIALDEAVEIFKASVIKSADLNNDGKTDVGDLAIVAYYYGVKFGDPAWDEAKIADMNNDNIIDIADLAYVALRIPD